MDHFNWSFDSYVDKDLERDRGRALYSAFAKAVDWDSDRDSHKDFDRAAQGLGSGSVCGFDSGSGGEHLHKGVDNLKKDLDRDLDRDLERVWGTSCGRDLYPHLHTDFDKTSSPS